MEDREIILMRQKL